MADIFISYTSSDRDWAFWIARTCEALGHVPRVHEWEIGAGSDIYAWMERRHDAADHVLCVMSDAYLEAPYSTLERHAALWQAVEKRPDFVLMVAVEPCRLPSLSDHIRRCELYDLPEAAARRRFRDFMSARDRPESAAFPGRPVAVSNIPIRVPTHFMGRDAALAAIAAGLGRSEGRVAVTALHGLRGVGKTTLAAAYAEAHRANYRATWWIRAQTASTMRADLVALGVRLGWVAADDKEEPALAVVMERLRHEGEGLLLVYDNAVDARSLAGTLPRGGASRVIITSSDHAWRGVAAEPVEISLWPKEVGADYLAARTGRATERANAEALSQALGGLPLAHEQAAAYCEQLGASLADYARRFAAAPVGLLDDDDTAPGEYHDGLTVAKTFALAIAEAAKLHPAAEPLLLHAALLAPEPIPVFLFEDGREALGEPLASLLAGDGLDRAVAKLRRFALVDREEIPDERDPEVKTDCIRLHRLVREVSIGRWTNEAQEKARSKLKYLLCDVYPGDVFSDPATWPRARRLDVIATKLLHDLDGSIENDASAAWLFDRLASYRQRALSADTDARVMFERSLKICESVYGVDSLLTAAKLNNLGIVLRSNGDFKSALDLSERALAICERQLGSEHTDTAICLMTLSEILSVFDLDAARSFAERGMRIFEKQVGSTHPGTAGAHNQLGVLYAKQKNFDMAIHHYEIAIKIYDDGKIPEDLDLASTLFNLGLAYIIQSKESIGVPVCLRFLLIEEKLLGIAHPSTLESLRIIVGAMEVQRNPSAARLLLQRVLAAGDRASGGDATVARASAVQLSLALDALGEAEQAVALRRRYGLTSFDPSVDAT